MIPASNASVPLTVVTRSCVKVPDNVLAPAESCIVDPMRLADESISQVFESPSRLNDACIVMVVADDVP